MRIRHRPPIIALLFAIAIGTLAGCMNREAPLSPTPPTARFSEAVGPVLLVFIERSYDLEGDQTTFLYQLQNTPDYNSGGVTQTLTGILGVFTDVAIELPSCAGTLSSYFPTDGATIDTTVVGFNGITWGVGYDENPDYYYSVTFPGDVAQGVVRGLVTTGGFTYVQNIAGPCAGTYQVAGTVFTDANSNGVLDANEFGVANVTVAFSGGEGTQTVKTDSEGNYIFIASDGSYTVSVDSLTADNTDFNETLFDLWNPTTPLALGVTIGPDSGDNDFGFESDIDRVIEGIDNGEYPTTGKSYKWWRKEFLRVINGNHNTAYNEAQLLDFAHQIEDLAILSEYDWTPGQELQQIYNILNNHAFEDGDGEEIQSPNSIKGGDNGRPDDWARLLRELLTTELNHVSGRGLANLFLQEVLVNWGEGVLNNNRPGELAPLQSVIGTPPGDTPNAISSPLDASRLFGKINGATGGGGTGE